MGVVVLVMTFAFWGLLGAFKCWTLVLGAAVEEVCFVVIDGLFGVVAVVGVAGLAGVLI